MYDEMIDKKTVNEIEQELFLKNQRVNFWEKYHSVPTDDNLIWWRILFPLIWRQKHGIQR